MIGHSVGATIAFALALGLGLDAASDTDAERTSKVKFKAIVGVEGIYDFTALRDAHLEFKDIYEEFTTAALGDESSKEWEKANIARMIREGREVEGVEVVMLGQSRRDELVEWGQLEIMTQALKGRGWGEGDKGKEKEISVIELSGGHDEIWEKGEAMARCIRLAVERCVGRDLGQDS